MWDSKLLSITVALAIGIVFVWFGALNAFFVGLFVLGGWLVGKFLTGEFNIYDLLERVLERRQGRGR